MRVFILLFALFVYIGCDKAKDSIPPVSGKKKMSRADSLMAVADSIRKYNVHIAKYGYHQHKDLAQQAHVNPKKKRAGIAYRNKKAPIRRRSRKLADERVREFLLNNR